MGWALELLADELVALGEEPHSAYRGQNYGKALVSAAMQDAFARDYWVLYQALETNRSSVALAATLGCHAYARTLGVHLLEGGV